MPSFTVVLFGGRQQKKEPEKVSSLSYLHFSASLINVTLCTTPPVSVCALMSSWSHTCNAFILSCNQQITVISAKLCADFVHLQFLIFHF